jgi:hypothetical protein
MSILGKIIGGIWDRAKGGPGYRPEKTTAPTGSGTVAAPSAPPPPVDAGMATSPQPHTARTVDVEGILDFMNQQRDQKLNWRTSIVDLMKLTGMDSSLSERKELAQELGYSGDMSDSATMNIWLHEQVIQKIRDNGGQIRNLTD